jgi:hypothetical protein
MSSSDISALSRRPDGRSDLGHEVGCGRDAGGHTTIRLVRDRSASNDLGSWVETVQVRAVAANNQRVMLTCCDDYRRVHHVGRPGVAAVRACKSRHVEIERFDDCPVRLNQPGELCSARSITPHLADHAGGNDDRRAIDRSDLAQGQYLAIAFLNRYQRASIED